MSNSVLARLSGNSFSSNPNLTSIQSQTDSLIGHFVEEAGNWKTLAAISTGTLFYRYGRLGALALAGEAGRMAPLVRVASYGIGLGAEVSAFEMTNRSLTSLTEDASRNPNLWRWSGMGGIGQGLTHSFIAFGTLKGFGRAAQGENIVAQHLFQDSGMVLGNQLSGIFGITPAPTGTLAEQFLHAEAVNLQLAAGLSLTHSMAPRAQGMERALDLNIRSRERTRPFFSDLFRRGETHFGTGLEPAFSPAGAGATGKQRSAPESPAKSLIHQMSGEDRPGGKGSDSGIPPAPEILEAGTKLRVPVGTRAFLIPDEGNLEQGIREFIEDFDFPVAVAKMGGMFAMGLGDLWMVNEAYTREFGWRPEEATSHSVTYFFPKLSLLKVLPRVREIQKKNGGVFEETDLEYKHKDRQVGYVPIIGSGVIRNIYGNDIAFGFLKPKSKTAAQTVQGDQLTEMLKETDAMNELKIASDGAIEFHSLMGINIQFMDPNSPLLNRLTESHQKVRITGSFNHGDDLKEYVPYLLQSLNSKSKKFSFQKGTTLKLEIAATQASVSALRKSEAEGWVIYNENYAGFGYPASRTTSLRPPGAPAAEEESPWLESIRKLGGTVPKKKDDPGKR